MSQSPVSTIEANVAAEWLATGKAVLVDVREPDEFRTEHVAAAISIPLRSLPALFDVPGVPAGRPIIFQCQKGSRGATACNNAASLAAAGAVYNLAGGIEGWKAAGLPVIGTGASPAGAISIFRQVQIIVGTLVLLATAAGFAGLTPGFALAGLFGAMLAVAGLTGWCGLALLLQRMPWNAPPRPRLRSAGA